MQRVRLRFRRGEQLKYLGHLDLFRLWERAFRRSGLPLAYSAGFSPHPRLSMAAPLPVGVTSECELMDAVLERPVAPPTLIVQSLNRALPPGLEVSDAWDVPPQLPSLQSLVRFAEYQVVACWSDPSPAGPQTAIAGLLGAESLPWQQQRDKVQRHYDLRPLVDAIWVEDGQEGRWTLGMRLRHDNRGAGRAEQVTAALGFPGPPLSIHRRQLILETPAPGQGQDGHG
ncbi:MAG: DUF2344 domain-containing protein [Dehalococcoidia bacterium]|nr:DUF2344 domain-containing protein [Dehalococcoidia bacterium]